MSYAQETGYVPETFEDVMEEMRLAINFNLGTSFTQENFQGSNWYKYLYGPVQKLVSIGVKASEIFLKLQEYISQTNIKVLLPSGTFQGVIDAIERAGYIASVSNDTAGVLAFFVDVDDTAPDYPEWKLEIANLLKQYVTAGIQTIGTETETLVLTNGQSWDFSFSLPDYIDMQIRVTISKSPNVDSEIPSESELKQLIFENIYSRYRLGWQFEPQRYLTISDLPWADEIIFEYSDDGVTWDTEVLDVLDAGDKIRIGLDDIQVILP